ncbi:MAG: hypothetical protein PHC62_11495 [Candidatus Izemoplasmatales bacterium]|nr:hypothetical protein [Candidatus Izemoplasmatales bacterium]
MKKEKELRADNIDLSYSYISFGKGIVAMPEKNGYLIHEETNTTNSVYTPISFFKRLMLKWFFGLKDKNNKN